MPYLLIQRMLLIIMEAKAVVQVLPIPVGDGSQRMVDLPQPFLGKVKLFGRTDASPPCIPVHRPTSHPQKAGMVIHARLKAYFTRIACSMSAFLPSMKASHSS